VSKSLDGSKSEFQMKHRKEGEENGGIAICKTGDDVSAKLEDDRDYFANDTSNF